jgi:hypothetical protein
MTEATPSASRGLNGRIASMVLIVQRERRVVGPQFCAVDSSERLRGLRARDDR